MKIDADSSIRFTVTCNIEVATRIQPVRRRKAVIGLEGKTLAFDLQCNAISSNLDTQPHYRAILPPHVSIDPRNTLFTLRDISYHKLPSRTVFLVSGVDYRKPISLEYVVCRQPLLSSHKYMHC